jgi:hypothetical protein
VRPDSEKELTKIKSGWQQAVQEVSGLGARTAELLG